MQENNELKLKFKQGFNEILDSTISFKSLLYEIFVFGSAYVVGGFFRDIINKKKSRDIDIIIELEHTQLLNIVRDSGIKNEINRHKGIKLFFPTIEVDIWSIEDNWAFKNNLVKLNEEDKLNSIAKGCFYNYDALVINLHSYNFNIKYYREFTLNNTLDILQASPTYKNLNPTIEANILRAFFLRKTFGSLYSNNTKRYLISKIGEIKDKGENPIDILVSTKTKYPKYNTMDQGSIIKCIDELIMDNEINNQFLLNI